MTPRMRKLTLVNNFFVCYACQHPLTGPWFKILSSSFHATNLFSYVGFGWTLILHVTSFLALKSFNFVKNANYEG